jgi:integration host factor subunit alpha
MTLTKAHIVNSIRSQTGYTGNRSAEIVKTLLELIKGSLASEDDVLISGFGKFSVREKNKRRGRNPATGGSMMLKARKVVTFKSSWKLREKINNNSR